MCRNFAPSRILLVYRLNGTRIRRLRPQILLFVILESRRVVERDCWEEVSLLKYKEEGRGVS